MDARSLIRQLRDAEQFKGDSLSPDNLALIFGRAAEMIEKQSAALADILGLLDDPTGGEHVEDMRRASERARDGLGIANNNREEA